MESPSCIQDEPFPHPLEPEPSAPAQPGATKPGDKRFRLWYVGGSCLDRRTTLPMLPWLMAEIRRRSQKPDAGGCGAPAAREVILVLSAPFLRCVPAPGAGVGGGRRLRGCAAQHRGVHLRAQGSAHLALHPQQSRPHLLCLFDQGAARRPRVTDGLPRFPRHGS